MKYKIQKYLFVDSMEIIDRSLFPKVIDKSQFPHFICELSGDKREITWAKGNKSQIPYMAIYVRDENGNFLAEMFARIFTDQESKNPHYYGRSEDKKASKEALWALYQLAEELDVHFSI